VGREKLILTNSKRENEKLFLDKLAFKKYKNWEYEKEYRKWVKLEGCKKDKNKYFIEFNNNLKIKEIILGCKFNYKKQAEEIKELAKENGILTIIPTREEWSGFRVNPCGTKKGKFFPESKA
jgi:hypothetical protein